MPTVDPNYNHDIPLGEAAELTKRYRESASFGGRYGGLFGRTSIESILAQEKCAGIRYYYGLDASNEQVLVLVGVDGDNNDMVDGVILEMSLPCPALCDNVSPLKTN